MDKPMMGIAMAALAGIAAQAEMITFDKDVPGMLPAGWIAGVTGRGTPHWTVDRGRPRAEPAERAQAIGQRRFPVVREAGRVARRRLRRGEVQAASPGSEDQAGGVVWRWKDGDNYYVARANALENNVSLYYTERGRRNTIKYVDAPVAAQRVAHAARGIPRHAHPRDRSTARRTSSSTTRTSRGAGAVGVWTKADSVTAFDDFAFGAAR